MSEERRPGTLAPHTEARGAKDEAMAPGMGPSDGGPQDTAAETKRGRGISRREFARRAAIASAVASLAPVGAAASAAHETSTQTPSDDRAQVLTQAAPTAPAAEAHHAPALTGQQPNLPNLTPEGQAEADARFQAILAQYGTRFSEEQKTDLRRLCTMAQPPLDRLRAYTAENGVSSALYLKPLVEREKKPAVMPPATTSPASATPAGKTPGAPHKP